MNTEAERSAPAAPARRLLVVSAGLGQPSATRLLADRLGAAAVAALEGSGVPAELEVVELRPLAHDVVNAMLTGFAAGELAAALSRVASADGLIVVTPIFTTSYSGLFKSFVDVLDPQSLAGKPVLLGATGGTPRHSLALEYAVRPLFTYLHAQVANTAVFAATDDWAQGGAADKALPARIARAGAELAEMVAARPTPAVLDPFDDVPSFEQLLRGS